VDLRTAAAGHAAPHQRHTSRLSSFLLLPGKGSVRSALRPEAVREAKWFGNSARFGKRENVIKRARLKTMHYSGANFSVKEFARYPRKFFTSRRHRKISQKLNLLLKADLSGRNNDEPD
jgi:hypothetical protein